MRLEGKVAIITGAGQTRGDSMGNGRAAALLFAREGAKLLLANRSASSLDETRELLRKEGFDAECTKADISKEDNCAALMKIALSKFGQVDILHNNVGIGEGEGDTTKIDRGIWDNVFDVNLSGAMLISKHVLPIMRAQKHGSITHVSSIAAIASYPLIAYKTSKAALHEFVRWLAFENAPHNIRCNVLMLGFIDTPMAIERYHAATGVPREDLRKQRDKNVPMGRMGSALETAKAALFLASDDASYITGAVIPVDGGLHTRVG
ncbi:SDR family NAD(P)-dependent oxidoreductase [Bradyrhizobium sp.]|uniref:SDR family NAD(P)-dependent oxidoreductase n=1 Tax=Bradyrhizobium sp. TaxID=376 RepID=UPI001EC10437|nr:SDR family NAD(P)-dependent oxidoreductase [Bradyrhizobium sp.]MBV9985711.1 SDR family oxidoreductase [Bradyrhizobium sp.]